MAHVKRRVKTWSAKDGTIISVTVYQAVWRERANGSDKTKEFRRKSGTERFLVDMQHRLFTGAYADPLLGKTPFREAAERYLALGVWRPSTRRAATEKLRSVMEEFGDRPIATIRKGDLQPFFTELSTLLAPVTVRIVRQHVAATFNQAIDDRLIGANPALGLRMPKVPKIAIAPLLPADVDRRLDAADPWDWPCIVIGAGLGVRVGDAVGLTVDRIDFLRRTTRIDRQWRQGTHSQAGEYGPQETAAGTRTISTSQRVLDQLAVGLRERPRTDAGIIVTEKGAPIDAARWGHYFRRTRSRAGLPDSVTYHDLRHFFASVRISAGCSVKQVQVALGHESAKVTLDVYAHLFPGDDDRVHMAVDRLGSASARDNEFRARRQSPDQGFSAS